jgi:tetratricopeptide (TPR) repeat protein
MNILKLVPKIIFWVFCLGLVALVGYGIWWAFYYYWISIIFGIYCFFGVSIILVCLAGQRFLNRAGTPQGQSMIPYRIANSLRSDSFFQRFRTGLGYFLNIACTGLLPWETLLGAVKNGWQNRKQMHNISNVLANERLHPTIVTKHLMTLIIVSALYGISYLLTVPNDFGKVFLLLMVLGVLLKSISYSVNPVTLTANLRQSLGIPYLNYLVIAIILLATFILSLAGGLYGVPNVTWEGLVALSIDMHRFQKIYGIFTGEIAELSSYFITLAGFIFYTSVLGTVIKYREFIKTEEDYAKIAQSFLFLGKFNDALLYLDKIKTKDQNSLMFRAVAYIGVNQIQKAIETHDKAQSFAEKEFDNDMTYALLISTANIYPLPNIYVAHIFQYWLETKTTSSLFVLLSDFLMANKKLNLADYKKVLIKTGTLERNKLAHVQVLLFEEKFQEAFDLLKTLPEYQGLDKLLIKFYSLVALTTTSQSKEDLSQKIEQWMEEELRMFADIVINLGSDEEKILGLSLFFQIKMIFTDLAAVELEKNEELNYIIKEIKESLSTEEFKQLGGTMLSIISEKKNAFLEDLRNQNDETGVGK